MRFFIPLLLAIGLSAQSSPVERIPWTQSVERFAGLEVEVKQLDGKRFRGTWVAVENDSYTLKTNQQVEKLNRSQIRTVHTVRRQVRGRVLGAIGGYVLGGGLILMITGSGEGGQGLPGLLMPALSGLGFWAGREIDRDRKSFEFY
jgi:hypothetical protein